ncbi:carbohydrate ABC transporter permease [Microbacterium dauci]|uniref:Sugar ABC transporter permease n=1 Tax=Microbacterium dauci TaxID=3048008 RepID=A0ABT6ZG01_9MICO|nr:sugar ABC transporter permease [Microbacterium sp. LX3-4]MDJ1115090.1 sugar ABC transporter permease [Microbacterium sp. LX3-4]
MTLELDARRRNDPVPDPTPRPDNTRRRRPVLHSNRTRLLFVVPALILFSSVVVAPIVANLFYAFTDWNGFSPAFNFIGLENFGRVFTDPENRQAALNTLLFATVNSVLQLGLGLALALSLFGSGKLRATLRLMIVLPIAISGVVLGFIGTIIFDPRTGLLAAWSHLPGMNWLAQNWLGDPSLAMGTVIFMNLWQWTGFTMLIFLAGLSTIPGELIESATIDGAGPWRRFAHVTWPLLAPSTTINVVMTAIGGFKVFDIVYVLTKGGPGGATETIVSRAAMQGSFGQFGYSAATNLMLTLGVLLISVLLLAALRRRELRA